MIKIRKEVINEVSEEWVDGYAAVFNEKSKMLFEDGKFFYEVINPRAFDEILSSKNLNVKAVVNHDDNKILGRNKSGTLLLDVDERGLKYSIKWGDTQLHKDTIELIERGDLFESSFKYYSKRQNVEYKRDEEGNLLRIVNKIDGLYDVSLVTDGAFSNTDIYLRSIKEDVEVFELNELKERELKEKFETYNKFIKEIKDDIKGIDG